MKWDLKAAIVLKATIVLALHLQQEMSKRPFASMIWIPVHMTAASVIGLLSFWKYFWHSFSWVKRVLIDEGGDQSVEITA